MTEGSASTPSSLSTGPATAVADLPAQPGPGGRIVVGVDGSARSVAALRWALTEGTLRGAPVHVVLTWMMPPVTGTTAVQLPPESTAQAAARHRLDHILPEVAGAAAERPEESPVTSEVVEHSPAAGLLAAAEDASLLVVGSRGHGGFAGLLLGSVSQQCVAHARCPVAVIHDR